MSVAVDSPTPILITKSVKDMQQRRLSVKDSLKERSELLKLVSGGTEYP
jgi:hypothetical protein